MRLLHEAGVEDSDVDRTFTANAVARQLGMDTVFAEVLPEDEANEAKKLQANGRKVAMVGDGVNDCPSPCAGRG